MAQPLLQQNMISTSYVCDGSHAPAAGDQYRKTGFRRMGEIFLFLGRLSLGEFLVIWVFFSAIVCFFLIMLYQLNRIEKDANLLIMKIDTIAACLTNKHKLNLP
jgi:hypothetical protein